MTLSPFFQHSFLFCSLLSLILALFSLWIKKKPWIWGGFVILSLFLAYSSHVLQPIAFIPCTLLFLSLIGLKASPSGLTRFILVGATLIISGGLFYGILPGFSSFLTISSFAINYGKLFAGILLLSLYLHTIEDKSDLIFFMKTAFPISLLGSFIATAFIFYMHPPKSILFSSSSTVFYCIPLLVFQIIPEEAFFRGFIQKELCQWTGSNIKGGFCAVVLSSLLFCLFNLLWVSYPILLGIFFILGLTYGFVYQITGRIEASIFCRFITTLFYFFLPF